MSRPINLLGAGKCRVYVIEMGDTGCFKIGKSCHPYQRFASLSLPYPIKIICVIRTAAAHRLEQKLHSHFSHKRMNSEWFKLNADDVAYIKALTGARVA